MLKKELAKFFAGVAADQTVVHFALGVSGVLPLKLFGISLTQRLNTFGTVFWPIVLILLVYYAWIRKEGPNPT